MQGPGNTPSAFTNVYCSYSHSIERLVRNNQLFSLYICLCKNAVHMCTYYNNIIKVYCQMCVWQNVQWHQVEMCTCIVWWYTSLTRNLTPIMMDVSLLKSSETLFSPKKMSSHSKFTDGINTSILISSQAPLKPKSPYSLLCYY